MIKDFKLSIYESGLNPDEKDYLLYLIEKKTEKEYRKRQMKRYYQIKEPTFFNDGEMTVRGEKIPMTKGMGLASMQNATGKIHVDLDKMAKIKGARRRDAIIQHEIGHRKLHSYGHGTEHLDMKKTNRKQIHDRIDKYAPPEFLDELNKYNKTVTDEYLGKNKVKEDPELIKKREEFRERNKKNTSGYADLDELEADQYAANRTGMKHLIKGLRQAEKNNVKEYEKTIRRMNGRIQNDKNLTKDEKKQAIESNNKKLRDFKKYQSSSTRSSALKDKTIPQQLRDIY